MPQLLSHYFSPNPVLILNLCSDVTIRIQSKSTKIVMVGIQSTAYLQWWV